MLPEETVYLGCNNIIALALSLQQQTPVHTGASVDDSVVITHSHPVITRCQLLVDPIVGDDADAAQVIDSQAHSTWFDFATSATTLFIKLGESTLKKGRHVCSLKLYTAEAPQGLIWGQLMLVIQ